MYGYKIGDIVGYVDDILGTATKDRGLYIIINIRYREDRPTTSRENMLIDVYVLKPSPIDRSLAGIMVVPGHVFTHDMLSWYTPIGGIDSDADSDAAAL
jgi:hypothetical protein